ncbi:restriction endonuclease subunit S [Ligilactobacillus salivarius]|uniref:restriction endonuclease subunit S n=2 Tax=Ligilactobacillus salivarius TaxID=1624 RepID=UPI001CBBA42E|nr:restriction endonuclease subunit S [Ligilactobacillus salivarius]
MWEQQELGAVVEFYSGLTYKPENVVQNGTLVIRSSNIHNNQYINADNVYVKNNIVNSEYVQEQDIIVVVRNGSRNLIGKHALLKSIPHDPSVIGAFMTGIRSLNNQFIEAVLNTEKFKREINKNLGATINQITTSQFKKMKFNFPKREEDKQIGILFNYLDDTIQLHERKCEELALIKQALLQKLFPKKDEVIPEVRYKSFSAAWEQRKLGDISKTKRGLTYKPSNIDNTGIRVLRSSNIKEDTFVISDNDVFVKESAVNIPFVKNGDILITAANGSTNLVGKHAIIRDIPKNSAVHGGFMLITTSKEYEFLNASMSSNWYKKFIKKYVAGGNGAIGNLRKNDLDNQKIYVPKKDEQEKIGNFFKMLDSLITLHQRKLEKLKQLKKFLLQNMFI